MLSMLINTEFQCVCLQFIKCLKKAQFISEHMSFTRHVYSENKVYKCGTVPLGRSSSLSQKTKVCLKQLTPSVREDIRYRT